ncbi:MAG: hypothetical protein ACRCTQ_03660 [Brevinemataceae bacterium]
MKNFKILLLLGGCCLTGCGPSPIALWLQEYEVLLMQASKLAEQAPFSSELDQTYQQIAQKETEIDALLQNSSVQDQMSFLSKYYDMRVRIYYRINEGS